MIARRGGPWTPAQQKAWRDRLKRQGRCDCGAKAWKPRGQRRRVHCRECIEVKAVKDKHRRSDGRCPPRASRRSAWTKLSPEQRAQVAMWLRDRIGEMLVDRDAITEACGFDIVGAVEILAARIERETTKPPIEHIGRMRHGTHGGEETMRG